MGNDEIGMVELLQLVVDPIKETVGDLKEAVTSTHDTVLKLELQVDDLKKVKEEIQSCAINLKNRVSEVEHVLDKYPGEEIEERVDAVEKTLAKTPFVESEKPKWYKRENVWFVIALSVLGLEKVFQYFLKHYLQIAFPEWWL